MQRQKIEGWARLHDVDIVHWWEEIDQSGAKRQRPMFQQVALSAIDQLTPGLDDGLLFPAPRGGYFDLHNFRNRYWKEPFRRVYVLRHTFATFALRAGVSTLDLSRYIGASLTMIDRHYGHLARDRRAHAIRLLDSLTGAAMTDVHAVDARWTPDRFTIARYDNGKTR